MVANLINYIAAQTKQTKAMLEEIAEFRALKKEIDKARCVIEFQADGNITSMNENACRVLGYKTNELINQPHRALLDRADGTSLEYKAFWENLKKGQSESGIFKLQNNSGNVVWMQGYYAPIMHSSGQLRKVVAYLTDITNDKVKSLHLEAEDAGINKAFGVLELSLDTEILEINELSLSKLGYKREELIGKKLSFIMREEDQNSKEYKALWEKVKLGKIESYQVRRIAKDGSEIWLQASYFPVSNHEGKPEKVIVYTTDITEEKNKSIDYQYQMDAITEVMGKIEFDMQANVIAVNPLFARIVGYTATELIGKPHKALVESAYANSLEYKTFWDKLRAGEYIEAEFKRVGKNGKDVWLQARYTPIKDSRGKPYKVVKFAVDITESMAASAESRRLAKEAILVKTTLDSASTNMMMADNDGVIRYMNESTNKLMHEAVSDMRKVLPNFNPDKIVGENFDIFHGRPSHQRNLLASLTKPYETVIQAGSKYFKLKASPIFNSDKERLGTSLEWIDISAERSIEQEMSNLVEAAAKGDLRERLSLNGKSGAMALISEGINSIIDKMTDIIVQVRVAGETISTASGEISTGNNDLSSRTEQQASSLEETASSMEELASTVKQNAENAKQANQLAAVASSVAVKGGQVVDDVVTTMSAINESSRKIEDIISVIDGIAFQTNILALNAAVEAARAGEQGRGFAVVAGEVRNLAQRSASAAKEIKELITDSVAKTSEGTKLVENAGATMTEIVSSVQRVTDIMGEISAASSEQSSGIDQVNDAINSMDEVTQQNAALVEEAAAAAESLVEQANGLMDLVGSFKLRGQANQVAQSKNSVTKTHSFSKSAPVVKPTSRPVLAKTGTDDSDWAEF